MAKKQEKEIERWVTVNGARVPIFKDGSIGGPKALRDKVKAKVKDSGESKGYKSFTLGSDNRWSAKDGESFDNNEHELSKHSRSSVSGIQGKIKKSDDTTKEKQISRNRKEADDRNGKSDISKEDYETSKGLIKENTEAMARKREAIARVEASNLSDKEKALRIKGLKQDIESMKQQNIAAHKNIKEYSGKSVRKKK